MDSGRDQRHFAGERPSHLGGSAPVRPRAQRRQARPEVDVRRPIQRRPQRNAMHNDKRSLKSFQWKPIQNFCYQKYIWSKTFDERFAKMMMDNFKITLRSQRSTERISKFFQGTIPGLGRQPRPAQARFLCLSRPIDFTYFNVSNGRRARYDFIVLNWFSWLRTSFIF